MKRLPPALVLRLALLSAATFAVGSLVLGSASCTAIGFAIGGDLANRTPPHRVPAGTALTARIGTPLMLALEDSTTVRGYYLGRVARDEVDYERACAAWHSVTPGSPALGDSIVLIDRHGDATRAVFLGFAYRAVHVTTGTASGPHDVRFATLESVRVGAERTWTRDQLAALDAAGALPSREALRVGVGLPLDWHGDMNPGPGLTEGYRTDFPDTSRVPVDRVALVWMPADGAGGYVVGTLVGLSFDLLVIKWAHDVRDGCEAVVGFLGNASTPTERPFDTWAGAFVNETPEATASDTRERPAVDERGAHDAAPGPPPVPAPSVAVPAAQ